MRGLYRSLIAGGNAARRLSELTPLGLCNSVTTTHPRSHVGQGSVVGQLFGIGMPELLVILVVALVVLGPKRLPEVARSLGKGLAEFRRATSDVTDEMRKAKRSIEDEARAVEREAARAAAGKPPKKKKDKKRAADDDATPSAERPAATASAEAPTGTVAHEARADDAPADAPADAKDAAATDPPGE